MRIGICASVSALPDLANCGLDFLEENVQSLLTPLSDESVFQQRLAAMPGVAIPIKVANCFLPAAVKCVGPEVDMALIQRYATAAFQRAAEVGMDTIVFGSGMARRVPVDYPRDTALAEFCRVLRLLGPLAAEHGLTLVLEPLNRSECNLITSLNEGAQIVHAVNHPNIRLMADIYHMGLEAEDPEYLEIHSDLIRHVHVAEWDGRTCPGVVGDDFRPYLSVLRRIGYFHRISIECRWHDLATEAPIGTRYLRQVLHEVGY